MIYWMLNSIREITHRKNETNSLNFSNAKIWHMEKRITYAVSARKRERVVWVGIKGGRESDRELARDRRGQNGSREWDEQVFTVLVWMK